MSYSGDVTPDFCWKALQSNKDALLVDVRTQAEWTFVGVPDLRPLGKSPILVEWQRYPGMGVNQGFVAELSAELRKRGASDATQVYFLCRTGGRSRAAAEAMTAAGFQACFNVASGFEGEADGEQHRGQINGWKAQGLPWFQN
jgi:rhodanese-related sulfurtransferase